MKLYVLVLAFLTAYACFGKVFDEVTIKNNLDVLGDITGTHSGFTASRALETNGDGDIISSSVTSTDLSYLDATSSIQGQLDDKVEGKGSGTDNTVPLWNGTGALDASSITETTLNFLDATSSIQGQLNDKAPLTLTTGGDILYYDSGYKRLAKGADTQVLTLSSGLPSWQSSASAGNPTGTIITFAGASCPSGYLEADGSEISRTTYSYLYTVTGDIHGYGDNSTTFNLPDLRGKFIRGYDNTASNDPDAATRTACNTGGATGDNVGSCQADLAKAVQTHNHQWLRSIDAGSGWHYNMIYNSSGSSFDLYLATYYNNTSGQWTIDIDPNGVSTEQMGNSYTNNVSATGTETRPKNVTMIYCIKY